jgi:hypothetical protein
LVTRQFLLNGQQHLRIVLDAPDDLRGAAVRLRDLDDYYSEFFRHCHRPSDPFHCWICDQGT